MESFIKKAMSLEAKFELIIAGDTGNALAAALRWACWKGTMENIKPRLAQFNVRTEESVQKNGFRNLRIIIERIGAWINNQGIVIVRKITLIKFFFMV